MDEKPVEVEEIEKLEESRVILPVNRSSVSENIKEISESHERILDSQEKTRKSLEETQKTVDHINDMLDGLVGIHERREYRREYGELAYRRKYFGDGEYY